MEANNLLDPQQFAYRHGKSTTQALLSMISAIKAGYQDNKSTIAVFIDIEGAFDSVWRNSLIYQLWEAGLRGQLFIYICNFLNDRRTRSMVNSFTSDWITTILG